MSPAEAAQQAPSGIQKSDISIPKALNPYAEAVGGAVANPATYIGPGTAALKLGASVGGALGSEAAGDATKGTPYESYARPLAGLAAGLAAAKAMGPAPPVAAIPKAPELDALADAGYKTIRKSDVLFSPEKYAEFGARLEQKLVSGDENKAFTGGQLGTAPQTLALVERLKATPPRGAAESYGLRGVGDELGIPTPDPHQNFVTPANVDTLRQQLGDIAGKTEPSGPGGRPKPTSDAAAAMVAKREVEDFLANPGPGAVLSGDLPKLQQDLAEARGNYKSLSQIRDIDYRQSKADVANDRNLTGSIGQKLRQNIGNMLVGETEIQNSKALRGYSPEAKALIQSINRPDQLDRALNTVGSLANYDKWNALAALGTGGAYGGYQLAASAMGHAARHITDKEVLNKVNRLVDQLGKESPEYAKRLRNLPPADTMSGKAAVVRALLNIQ
jgi:hypothetical protein